jgi:hypothetical protein
LQNALRFGDTATWLCKNGILAWFSARADEVIDLIDEPLYDAASD